MTEPQVCARLLGRSLACVARILREEHGLALSDRHLSTVRARRLHRRFEAEPPHHGRGGGGARHGPADLRRLLLSAGADPALALAHRFAGAFRSVHLQLDHGA
jgi:hypothetical protein